MKLSKVLRTGTIWMAILGMVLPTAAISAETTRSDIRDVALRADGTLRGQVVDASGQSARTVIQFHRDGDKVAETVSDANGQFVVHNLSGGVYAVQTPASVGHYRVWTNQAAPPAAASHMSMTSGDIVRGQCPPGPGHGFGQGLLGKPWLFAAGIAAAIAIPIAVDNDRDRGPAS